MIRKILLAYDGSDNSRRALDLACEMASKLQADLYILHVLMHGRPSEEMMRMAEIEHLTSYVQKTVDPGVTFAAGRAYDLYSPSVDQAGARRVITAVGERLLELAKTVAEEGGVKSVHTEARNGDYADEIMDAAEEQAADMIVLGSRGLGKIRGTVLGGVSQKVLHHAVQTVVAVK